MLLKKLVEGGVDVGWRHPDDLVQLSSLFAAGSETVQFL